MFGILQYAAHRPDVLLLQAPQVELELPDVRFFHGVTFLDFVNDAIGSDAIKAERFAAGQLDLKNLPRIALIAFFMHQPAEMNEVAGVLHRDVMVEQIEFARADEVVVDVGAGHGGGELKMFLCWATFC